MNLFSELISKTKEFRAINIPDVFGYNESRRRAMSPPETSSESDMENYPAAPDIMGEHEKDANIEYMLSIHSTKMRSRRRLHIRGKDDIITIDRKSLTELDTEASAGTIQLLNDIKAKNLIARDSVSFSGGGYNCTYHLGVVKYIFTHPELFTDTKYLGASGGAGIVGIVLCYESDPDRLKVVDKLIDEIISMNGRNLKLHEQVETYTNTLENFVSEERFNQFIKDTNRCHISVTDVTSYIPRNHIISRFDTYKKYIQTLRASACIPYILDNKVRTIDSRSYLDGGLSNNMPTLNDDTIKISCLNYPFMSADVYPKILANLEHAFKAPAKNYVLNMYDLGYSDMERYMQEYKVIALAKKAEEDLDECITDFFDDPDNDF